MVLCGDPEDHSRGSGLSARAQKVFGWFGGHGFKGTMKYFTDKATNVEKKRTHRSF